MQKKTLWTACVLALSVSAASVALAAGNGPSAGASRAMVSKATGVTINNNAGTVDVCGGVTGQSSVTGTGTVDDGNGVDIIYFIVFDDGSARFTQQINIPVGQTTTTPINYQFPGQVGASAPGIGLYVSEDSAGFDVLASVDPFFPTPITGVCNFQTVNVPASSPWSLAGMLAAIAGTMVWLRRRRVI